MRLTTLPDGQLEYIEQLAKGQYSFDQMAAMFNHEFGEDWSRSKIGSFCYRRGFRVRGENKKVAKPVPPPRPHGGKRSGIVTGRAEFKAPPQQLPKPLPHTSFRPDMRSELKKPSPPVPPIVVDVKPQPSLNKTIVELAYKTDCKYATTSFDTRPADHRFCGHPVQPGSLYCAPHEKLCHKETPSLRKKR
jgi:hypothetical protein